MKLHFEMFISSISIGSSFMTGIPGITCLLTYGPLGIRYYEDSQITMLSTKPAFYITLHLSFVYSIGGFLSDCTIERCADEVLSEINPINSDMIGCFMPVVPSDVYPINSNVPSGSILSFTIFLLCIDNLLTVTFSNAHCYVD